MTMKKWQAILSEIQRRRGYGPYAGDAKTNRRTR